jgi:hypothetical protein
MALRVAISKASEQQFRRFIMRSAIKDEWRWMKMLSMVDARSSLLNVFA